MYSFSRVGSYEQCPYLYYLKYVSDGVYPKAKNGYSEYGNLVHNLEEKYYNGDLKKEELVGEFVNRFYSEVVTPFHSDKTKARCYNEGAEYFSQYTPFEGEIKGVEKRLSGKFADKEFRGIIDLIIEVDSEDGERKELNIIDHKTGSINNTTKYQLYLYAELIKQNYGRYPEKMIINSIKNQKRYEINFNADELADAEIWAEEIIYDIETDGLFLPKPDWFYCHNICDARDICQFKGGSYEYSVY